MPIQTTVLRALAALPLPILHAAGAVVGWLVYLVSPRFRKYLGENLAAAGYRGRGLLRACVAEMGKGALELPAIWLRSQEEAARLVVEVEGWERVGAALAMGRGVIMLTPHLGCWEVSAQYFSRQHPITVLYSPPKMASIEPLMLRGRSRENMKSVPPDVSGLRAMLRALHAGGAVGVLPDQVPGVGEGEWTEFFGRPAYTMTLVGRLAEKTGAPVLLGYAERLPRGRGYRVHVVPMPEALPGESAQRRLNRGIEEIVRRCPAQYLWAYNRYKVPAGVAPPAAGAQ
jgi:KDO2-lipid IV(A) lauroyltransferase